MTKICRNCNIEKDLLQFHKNGIYRKNQCSACITVRQSKWTKDNRDKRRAIENRWKENNRDKYLEKKRRNSKKEYYSKINVNIQYTLKKRLRTRLYSAVRNNVKSGSIIENLGCTIDSLKNYLESKFSNGMSWSNYGSWHIDHIKPLSSFDLSKIEDIKSSCHYTNLQPLWAIDNLRKGAKCG